jgi:L-ribulose-5-phosphate 4-epimerase
MDKDLLEKIKHELTIAAHRAYDRGIQTGNGGNLSARIPGQDLMIIKPSGGSFIECNENNWIIADFDGNKVEGEGKPSSEAPLHGEIYKLCHWANAIVHVHSVYANIVSLHQDKLPVYCFHGLTKLDDFVPVLDVKNDGVTKEDMPLIEKYFAEHSESKGFVLRRHGQVAYGKDSFTAEHNAELIEEIAQVAWGNALYERAIGKTYPELDQNWFDDFKRNN